jgi:glucose/arabinose dehydrogenase
VVVAEVAAVWPAAVGRVGAQTADTLDVSVVATGLATIWAVDFASDGRIFLTERSGRIRVIRDGQLHPEPWITLDDVVEVSEAGLLGLALDPSFAENGYVYVAYTHRGPGGSLGNRLVRLKEDAETGLGSFDAVLLDGVRGANNHDGGRVKFGPDGYLYWTMGEAGDRPLSQDLSSLNGKILRLNPDGSVPEDNPFPGSPIYSYGHRNPQGLAWQPGTDRLYSTEHGPSGRESCCDEVNHVLPGANYGWPQAFGSDVAPGTESPVYQSGQTTLAPGGATFITGGPWAGSLVFTGLRGEGLYRLVLDDGDPTAVRSFETYLHGQHGRLRDVVEGPDGALYVATSNRDGRGRPREGDDQLLRIVVRSGS